MERFNETKNDEVNEFKKFSYPYYAKKRLKFFDEEENINNENVNANINENICNNANEIEEQNNNKNEIKNNKIFLVSEFLIPEITKIYQKAKKFDYNFDVINSDFKDFIHNISFENDENKNIINIQNNISDNNIINTNYTKKKYIDESFSNKSREC